MTNTDLKEFMSQATAEMSSEYFRIRKRAKEDPGTAGDQGEENWAQVLREWLSPQYQVETKGRIVGVDGEASRQVDVLVLKPSYPRKLLKKKLYLAAGVSAAFECKTTLKPAHIDEAATTGAEIKRIAGSRSGSPYKDVQTGIYYGVLAHSFVSASSDVKNAEAIEKRIISADLASATHPREQVDAVCVADLGSWLSMKLLFPGQHPIAGTLPLPESCMTSHVEFSSRYGTAELGTPIGAFICHLMRAIAREDSGAQPLAEYFGRTGLSGSGRGSNRSWDASVYGAPTIDALNKGKRIENSPWGEWSMMVG